MCYSLIIWFEKYPRPHIFSGHHNGHLAAIQWAAKLLLVQEEGSYYRAALFDQRGEEVWDTDGKENGSIAG